MKLIVQEKDHNFAIPVNRIDWIKLEDAAGGKFLLKIGTGGVAHHYNFDNKESAQIFYNEVIDAIREL